MTHWLRAAERRVSRRWAGLLKEVNLLPSEWEALREMYKHRVASSAVLARATGMTKGGVSKLINRLVRKGFLTKEVSRFDRRYREIALTEVGVRIVLDMSCVEGGHEDASFRHLGSKLRRETTEGLTRAALRPRPRLRGLRPSTAPPPHPAPAPETARAKGFDPVQAVLDLCAKRG